MSRFQDLLGDRRFFIAFIAAVSLIFLVGTFIFVQSDDIMNYYRQVQQILSGHMPYSDMQFEYPPFAIVFFVIPGLVSWDISSYRAAFAVLVYIALFFLIYYSYKIADKCSMERWKVNLLIILLVVVGSFFIVSKYDIFPATMIIISLWLYMEKKYTLAFIVMALACMTKVYPAIFLIAMLIPFSVRREWKGFFLGLFIFAAVCVIVELPFLINDPSTAFAYLSYHSDRGLQIEAVVSSFIMVPSLFIPSDISIINNYGSHNLTGVLPDSIAPYMNMIMAASLLIFAFVMMYRINRSERAKENAFSIVGAMCLAMTLIFILFSKVYSAQYIIWIIPLMLFVLLPFIGKVHKRELTLLLVPFLIFTVLSYICYVPLSQYNAVAVLFTMAKNIFHIILTMEVLHLLMYETRPDDMTDAEEHGMLERFFRKSPE